MNEWCVGHGGGQLAGTYTARTLKHSRHREGARVLTVLGHAAGRSLPIITHQQR